MHKEKILPLLLSLPLLFSCFGHRQNPLSGIKSSKKEETAEKKTPATDKASSSATIDSTLGPKKSGEIHLFALNDFHGAVEAKGDEPGIVTLGSFFKEKGKEENTLILSSGDMFQGSLLSNTNRGKMLTEIMNNAQFDSFTLGNHEFDWGEKIIRDNMALADKKTGYKTPWLGGNIYQYDIATGKVGNYASLGEKYTVSTLENGIKVGIIGCIGEKQITSITSANVEDLTFVDPVTTAKTLSDELRTQKGCDAVVLDIHADQDDVKNKGLTEISPVSQKRYVDCVFCAHSHQREESEENGVYFLQGGYNGKAYSEIHLSLDEKGTLKTLSYKTPYAANLSVTPDPEITALYNQYAKQVDGSEKICSLVGSLSKDNGDDPHVSTMVSEAIFYSTTHYGNDFAVDYTMSNTSRTYLNSGKVTYEALFRALPFDNEVLVGKVKGSEILKESRYNHFTRLNQKPLDKDETYTIATIDYLATHRNKRRVKDYFPSFTLVGTVKKNGLDYNYRDITKDYLASLGTVKASDYSSLLPRHDKSQLGQSLT